MRNLRKQDDYWQPCRPGTILGVSDSKFRRQRRRFLVQSTMSGVVAAAGLFSALFVLAHRRSGQIGTGSGRLVDTNLVDGSVISKLASSRQRSARSPGPVRFTCKDIVRQLDNYLVAYRSEIDERTLMQSELLVDFDQHMKNCPSCNNAVLQARRDV